MKNLQRAINYEAIVKVLNKADSFVIPVFERLKDWCSVDVPLKENLVSYSYVVCCDEDELLSAYDEVENEFKKLSDNVEIIDSSDECWPKDIQNVEFLYLKGNKALLAKKGLSIVGTRLPSNHGMNLTKEAVDTVGSEYVIISGLAKGIDGTAHLQALVKGFETIAVLGTNIEDYYPLEHKKLQEIIAENGLLVSQFAPCRKTENYFFMNRNKVMSEIACGTLIAESADSGGGVKQALFADKQEKPVFIFREDYDNPMLHWPHDFENPAVIDSVSEILDYLNGTKQVPKTQPNLF